LAGHGVGFVTAFVEFLDGFADEGGQVVGLAAGDEAAVDDDVAIDPYGAGVRQVGLE
jgi:hypothetical protein